MNEWCAMDQSAGLSELSDLSSTLKQIKPASIRQRVVDTLRSAIIRRDFLPGQRLVEEEICEQLGVSRGPLREALRQLEQEGLVVSHPYKWTEVAEISDIEVREILMPIRITLEQFGFRHALQNLTDADLCKLQGFVDQMFDAAKRQDLFAVNDLDIQYHDFVLTAANQPHCLQLWRLVLPRVRSYFYQWTPRDTESLMWVAQQHKDLLEALKRRQAKLIEKVVKQHVLDTGFRAN